jgi:hypothetical protein
MRHDRSGDLGPSLTEALLAVSMQARSATRALVGAACTAKAVAPLSL